MTSHRRERDPCFLEWVLLPARLWWITKRSLSMHSDERRERIAAIGGILFPLSIIMLIA